ncbi:hypothetical protein GCM10011506_16020 [Marivirga lumbricoides]|uniref:Glycoside hydrolase n=1 Tax=Marivirga lumbricoides TaxID=1046115 RepID=A0ABQ1LXQ1_9BACT|nr:hypothetical protein GCM10011506_16020 [Marivirga lumbricoides]
MNKRAFSNIILILFFLIVSAIGAFYLKPEQGVDTIRTKKIHGFNLVAPREVFLLDSLIKVKATGAEWVALVPYAFCDATTGEITFDHPRQWWGEKSEGIKESIIMAQSIGLKVMLKPHLWVGGQGWAGDLTFREEALWNNFEDHYLKYIINYVKIADSLGVELFCIGTEVRNSTQQRSHFWNLLIDSAKSQYNGKLTYAANWDEYTKVSFWEKLDYIGIDAYFPLSEAKSPEVAELVQAWQGPMKEMQQLSKALNKPVLFTEYGYESTDYPGKGHWSVDKDTLDVNFLAQKAAFEAVYQTFNNQSWWSGGFIWKWHLTQNGLHSRTIKAYTPQNKAAMEVIKKAFEEE